MRARAESEELLGELHIPRLELPTLADGVDLGSLYELADHLAEQGVRPRSRCRSRASRASCTQ
ncbi:putative anion transporter ATPase [Mycobacteroides abscessus subsp. abscessus]|nr:putative anion transporter ATPase [Mycobacteroides abscessus subsp. abscessus]